MNSSNYVPLLLRPSNYAAGLHANRRFPDEKGPSPREPQQRFLGHYRYCHPVLLLLLLLLLHPLKSTRGATWLLRVQGGDARHAQALGAIG